jgi:hypothetical protein
MLHYLRQPCAPPHAMAGLVGRTKALTNSPSNCLQGCRQQRSDQGRKLTLFKAINPRRFNLDFIEAGLGELFVFAEARRRYDPLRASKTCRKWIFCPSVVVVVVLFNTLDRGCRIVVFEKGAGQYRYVIRPAMTDKITFLRQGPSVISAVDCSNPRQHSLAYRYCLPTCAVRRVSFGMTWSVICEATSSGHCAALSSRLPAIIG